MVSWPIYSVFLTFKCWETHAVLHSWSFKEKLPLHKSDAKIGFFLYFEKFCHWFLLEMYLNKNWYCSEFDLTGNDLGFTTRFWIPMIELFVIMNSFMITVKIKINGLTMDLWHSNNMKVILCKFAKGHCFWTLWTQNYVDFILFSYIDSFHMAHNQAK